MSKADPDEKKLQVIFGIAIGAVVLGVIAFVILIVKDLQH
jgi:hypothetical protein